jgi:hypothetical protein
LRSSTLKAQHGNHKQPESSGCYSYSFTVINYRKCVYELKKHALLNLIILSAICCADSSTNAIPLLPILHHQNKRLKEKDSKPHAEDKPAFDYMKIFDLPTDVLFNILSFLPPETCEQASQWARAVPSRIAMGDD